MIYTEQEKELIASFDYQIKNNGIEAIFYNGYYRKMFEYFDILSKEGSELSLEVSQMIKRAFILLIELNIWGSYENKPEFGMVQEIKDWKAELDKIEKRYWKLPDDFLLKFDIKPIKDSIKPTYEY